MKVRVETDGTIEGTKIINLRTGEEVKNLEVTEYIDTLRTFSIDASLLHLPDFIATTGVGEFPNIVNSEEFEKQREWLNSQPICTCMRAWDPNASHKDCL